MSGTGKVLFNFATGKVLFSPTSGKVLHSGSPLSWISPSEKAIYFGSKEYSGGGTSWTQTKYESTQAIALTAVRADTTLNFGPVDSVFATNIQANASGDYNTITYTYHRATRWKFAIPAGLRGSITKVRIKAECAAGKLWDFTPYTSAVYSALDDMGCSLMLFFSESSTAYGSGAALLDGAPDVTFGFDDINAAHAAAGRVIPVNLSAFPSYTMDVDAVASELNGYSSDTIYLWSVISRGSYLPYLFDPPSPLSKQNDFICEAKFNSPTIVFLE